MAGKVDGDTLKKKSQDKVGDHCSQLDEITVRYIKHYGKKGKTVLSLEIKIQRVFLQYYCSLNGL